MKYTYANKHRVEDTKTHFATSNRGFTIIELLIVIVIIGVLVAITAVSYTGITKSAKDAALRSDLKNAYTNAQLIAANPTNPTTNFTPSKGVNISYTAVTPAQPNSTNLCITASFPNDTSITSIHMTRDGQIQNGNCTGILTSCPAAGYIVVPGNPYYGTTDFCVMKYEAKNVGGMAVSQAAGTPWANITQAAAKTAATNPALGTGYHLITDPEWMTIAMNVINNPVNWNSGRVGEGFIYSGHNDDNPNVALDASASDSDGYTGTSNTAPSSQKRTLTLSNGEVIWDFAGNVWEWVDATITTGQPGLAGQTGHAWNEYTATAMQRNALPVTSWPTGTFYGASKGVGMMHTNPAETTLRPVRRGGSRGDFSGTGVWTFRSADVPTYSATYIGFRVAR